MNRMLPFLLYFLAAASLLTAGVFCLDMLEKPLPSMDSMLAELDEQFVHPQNLTTPELDHYRAVKRFISMRTLRAESELALLKPIALAGLPVIGIAIFFGANRIRSLQRA